MKCRNVAVCVQRSTLPKFLVRGHLDATNCVITQPLTGELKVENSDVPVKSIELQLVRVETCGEQLVQEDQESGSAPFHGPLLFVFRLCRRLCQRCHRDPEHPDR